jgi:glutathione-regulated potassium-efflux system ancillary protein KefF
MTLPPRILILYAHPAHQRSRVNRRLCEAAQTLSNVQVHDLYDNYPDFYIDVNREQELVASCDLLVFQHPIQWYGMPSLLKEWVDTVLEQGWAYGPEGNALRGKDFWLVATAGGPEMSLSATGGPEQALSAFLPPFERTAQCCGMHWISPLVVHGARDADDDLIGSYAEDYRRRLASYPAWVTDEAARRHEFIAPQK